MQTILKGSTGSDIFVLGKNGVAYGSNDPGNNSGWNVQDELEDDTVIIGLDPRKDTILLAGTKEDYLIRPTSLPFPVEGLPASTGALAIIMTDRNNRIMSSGEGNELTTIAWIVPPLTGNGPFAFARDIGLSKDPADYDNRGYYADNSGVLLRFEGGGVPLRSSQGGFIEVNASGSNSGSQINIKTSATQVSEGDSLLTTLETSYSSNTPLYFKVVGNGVNKKDFSSGGVKGRVFTGADGSASISHELRNDRATEGSESFKIQFFSDKKMRSLVGETNSIEALDTSTKAIKAPKRNQGTRNKTKDPVTGLSWDIDRVGTVVSDQLYDSQSSIIRSLNSLGGGSYTGLEFELSPNMMVVTRIVTATDGSTYYARGAYGGDFGYSNGKLSSATVNSFALYSASVRNGIATYEGVEITNFPSPRVVPDVKNGFDDAVGNDGVPRALSKNKWDGVLASGNSDVGNFNDIYSYGGGSIYSENWWLNPTAPNLV